MALAWLFRRPEMTSALIGIRTLEQLKDNLGALDNLAFAPEEIATIDAATADGLTPSHPNWW